MWRALLLVVSTTDISGKVTADYELTAKGKATIQITYIRELLSDGTLKVIQLRKGGSGKDAFGTIEGQFFAKDGSCTKATAIARKKGGSAALAVTFPKGKAVVTLEMTTTSKKTRREIPVPKGLTTKNPARYWFLGTQPKVGTKVTFADFSIATIEWKKRVEQYKGQVTIRQGLKDVVAHKVVGIDHVSFLDKDGLPLQVRYSDGQTLMRR